jgi:hypothetical protein
MRVRQALAKVEDAEFSMVHEQRPAALPEVRRVQTGVGA